MPWTMTADGGSSSSLSLLSEVWVLILHLLDHHDRVVICGVSRSEPGPVDTSSPRMPPPPPRTYTADVITVDFEQLLFLFTGHVDVFCLTSYKKYACMPFLYT